MNGHPMIYRFNKRLISSANRSRIFLTSFYGYFKLWQERAGHAGEDDVRKGIGSHRIF
jgi:hypothetical protein